MDLTEQQRKFLRRLAHPLSPLVLVGSAGLTDGIMAETTRALEDHELIKVRIRGADREQRDQILVRLIAATTSALVQRIGHVAVLYRPRKEGPGILIPDA